MQKVLYEGRDLVFRTKRFYLLLILLILLAGCLIFRLLYRSGERSGFLPQSRQDPASASSQEPPPAGNVIPPVQQSQPESSASDAPENTPEPGADVPYLTAARLQQIRERIALLKESCGDFVGWLYVADSDMDLPVVQGTDNDYYLKHAPDGSFHELGTIFLDCRCRRDLSDLQNILYGHNMEEGMFGDIRQYKQREAFERHRYGWLITAEQVFRIDFFALVLTSSYDDIYDMPLPHEQWLERIESQAIQRSDMQIAADDRIIALSTCATEFLNARALFTGRLVPVEHEDEILYHE